MTNLAYPHIGHFNDVETLNAWHEAEKSGEEMDAFLTILHAQGRDNAQTPMQWNDQKNSGFTDGEPWLSIIPNHPTINVAAQEACETSIFNYHRNIFNSERKIQFWFMGITNVYMKNTLCYLFTEGGVKSLNFTS